MDKEIKRLKRLIVISWMALVIIVAAFVVWASVQFKEMRNIIYTSNEKITNAKSLELEQQPQQMQIVGIKGDTGAQGLQGPRGIPGQNAVSTNTVVEKSTVIQQAVPIQGIQGEKGDKGDQGEPGRTPELAKNSDGQTVWRYIGDRIWQVLEVVQ